jgi:hypothetical protein
MYCKLGSISFVLYLQLHRLGGATIAAEVPVQRVLCPCIESLCSSVESARAPSLLEPRLYKSQVFVDVHRHAFLVL